MATRRRDPDFEPTPLDALPDPGPIDVSAEETARILLACRKLPDEQLAQLRARLAEATRSATNNRDLAMAIVESVVSLRPVLDIIRGLA
jgi:hypothetical protein